LTASQVFAPDGGDDGEIRRRAKRFNFGIMYGMSASAWRSGSDPASRAADYIKAYFARSPHPRLLDRVKAECRERDMSNAFGGAAGSPASATSNRRAAAMPARSDQRALAGHRRDIISADDPHPAGLAKAGSTRACCSRCMRARLRGAEDEAERTAAV